jgi:error-prone DNA polymerase
MGFYAPPQLVRNAREHGVEVLPVDVNHSDWDCTLELSGRACPALDPGAKRRASPAAKLRLGLRMICGLARANARRIVEARAGGVFSSIEEFARRTGLSRKALTRLAKAGVFGSLGLDRREALWHALAQDEKKLPLLDGDSGQRAAQVPPLRGKVAVQMPPLRGKVAAQVPPLRGKVAAQVPPPSGLPLMSAAEEVLADYRAAGLSLRGHPLEFLRPDLDALGVVPAGGLKTRPHGKAVCVAGIVLVRQRPATAKGITFVTLEDETGTANLIVRPGVWKRCREAAMGATLLLARGTLQRQGEIIHVLVAGLEDLSGRLSALGPQSRDFC